MSLPTFTVIHLNKVDGTFGLQDKNEFKETLLSGSLFYLQSCALAIEERMCGLFFPN